MLVPLSRIYEGEIVFVVRLDVELFLLFLVLPPEPVLVVVEEEYSLR